MSAKDKPVSKPATKEFRDNYDIIFGKNKDGKKVERCTKPVGDVCENCNCGKTNIGAK